MNTPFRRIENAESFNAFTDTLGSSGLPTDGLDFQRDYLLGYYENDELVGTGALEIHGSYGLLRSLSVRMGIRGKAIGSVLTERLLREARERNLHAIFLMTERASDFFKKKGFHEIARGEVPAEVRSSTEFSLPATAVAMSITLT